jgi:VWFA-related protein
MARTIALLIALILFVAFRADAAKRVTVAELAQALTEIRGKADADVAWQIGDLELTERLTARSLARMQSSLPGEKSKQALLALAEEGAYLDLPAAELPAQGAPDVAELRRMMGLVVNYVRDTIPQLPNFFATRETTRYEDTPQLLRPGGSIPYEPLHFRDRAQSTVLYRDGREVVEGQTKTRSAAQTMREGLSTWGVFGPILGSVLLDAAQSKLGWGHWEQGATALEAVFTFAVPKEKSHYEVNYCCIAEPGATVVAAVHPFRQLVGYHGEMAVDPNSGTILRLSVVADLKRGDPIVKAAIVVDYGPVELGGKSYLCPVRSISTTVAQTLQLDPRYAFALALQMQPLKTSVNEVAFEQYHMFRSDARVLTPAEAELARASALPAAAEGVAALPAHATGNPAEAAAKAASPEPAEPANQRSNAAATTPAPASAAAASSVPASEPTVPEFDVAAAPLPTDAVNRNDSAAATGFTLRTTTRLVDVALIAYDKKGHPVTDLKPEDLEVYDNGRKQEIRFFNQAGTGAVAAATAAPIGTAALSKPTSFSNHPAATNQAPAPATVNTTIFLIDASNVAFGDLTYARSEMLRFLKTLQPEERVALYIMKSYGFQILQEPTTDHATVATTLTHWMPSAQDLARAQDEETRNRQHIDWVAHNSDLAYVNGNDGSDPEGSASGAARTDLAKHGVDPKLRSMGSTPAADALMRLEAIAHHLASLPGHKSLVWVSSDNALADWSGQAAAREEKGVKDLDPLSMHARESLNEAHVSIYPLDVSQLEAGVISADLQNQLVKAREESPVSAPPPPPNPTGRYAAQMHQDTRPIDSTFRELAEATGGRALRRAGDIAAELNSIVADGRAAYLISFSPDMPADDTYHQITVKLAAKRDLRLHYRTGYLYAKDPASLKDRFKQAIWEPRDAGEISLTATPETTEKGPALRLDIRGIDLALAQLNDRQGNERWTDQLDIFLALRDDTTFNARVTGKSLRLRLMPGTYQKALQDGVPFEEHLPAEAHFDSARVVVIDRNSGRVGSITLPAGAFSQMHSGSR